jgi:murein DD-endopeptidase MepM/ murein hydrolase activator NlpD
MGARLVTGQRQGVPTTSFRVRALMALLMAVLAFGVTLSQASPAGAVEDPIARAQARQKAIQARIQKQRDAIDVLKQQQIELKAKLVDTGAKLDTINLDLDALRLRVSETTARVQSATVALESATVRLAELVKEIGALDGTVEFLQQQADQLRGDLGARRDLLSAHLAEAYRSGQTSVLEQMLSSDSLLDGMVVQRSYLALGEQDIELARSIERDAVVLASQQRQVSQVRYRTERLRRDAAVRAGELEVARTNLLAAKQKLEADQKLLAAVAAKTARLLAQEEAEHAAIIKNKRAAIELLKKQQAADVKLGEKIAKLIEAEQHRGRLPSQYNGTLRWPVKGTITQEFGCTGMLWEPPLGLCEHFHKGIDVVGDGNGPAIVAAADGVVLFVGFNPYDEGPDKAWIVIIGHSDHLRTWYAHLKAKKHPKAIKAGVKVKAGDVIGYQGSSGKSTGPHLHWAVELDSTFMDPRLFL